jgi:uncharacterized protein (DUF2126 family)
MTEPISSLNADHLAAIAMIAEKLRVPVSDVRDIYRKEFERLAARARIPNFLTVLTMGNVQSILRGQLQRAEMR